MSKNHRRHYPTSSIEQDIIDTYAKLKRTSVAQDVRAERERAAKATRKFWQNVLVVLLVVAAALTYSKFF